MIVAISAMGFYSNSVSSKAIKKELSEINVTKATAINRAQVNLLRLRLILGRYADIDVADQNSEATTALLQHARDAASEAQRRYDEFEAVQLPEGDSRATYVAAIASAYDTVMNSMLIPYLSSMNPQEFKQQQAQIVEASSKFDAAVLDFIRFVEARGTELIAADARSSRDAEVASIVLLILSLLATLLVRRAMMQTVVTPLQGGSHAFPASCQGRPDRTDRG